jgi:hypothetical protein
MSSQSKTHYQWSAPLVCPSEHLEFVNRRNPIDSLFHDKWIITLPTSDQVPGELDAEPPAVIPMPNLRAA